MTSNDETRQFFQKEYEKIADAHFNVSQRVTSFFQYILIIYSAPLFIFTDKINIDDTIKGIIFLIISLIDLFICMYICALRFESILYARVVNGVRRYMYENQSNSNQANTIQPNPIQPNPIQSNTNIDEIYFNRYSVLSIQTQKPPFYDTNQFIWIVRALSLLNSAYMFSGLFYIRIGLIQFVNLYLHSVSNFFNYIVPDNTYIFVSVILAIIYFSLHLFLYKYLANNQERMNDSYDQIIAFNLDDIISKFREHFCQTINSANSVNLVQNSITTLPICNSTAIDSDKEDSVINDVNFWNSMPSNQEVVDSLKFISQKLGYKIFVFANRNWKDSIPKDINNITTKWIDSIELNFDKLILEKYKPYSKIESLCFILNKNISKYVLSNSNRFEMSKKFKVKYFVEVDANRAVILSNICRYVFLISDPYNSTQILPINVIKISQLNDIYKYILEL